MGNGTSSSELASACMALGKSGGSHHLGRVLVLGLGKSGKSAARYCADLIGTRVDYLFIAAGAENDASREFVESLARPGVGYAFGDEALDLSFEQFDICIASPGIPYWHQLYLRGHRLSSEIISEVEFAWRESAPDSTWVAITGTNGKTTTTSLAAHILRECGFAADAVGNIGDVCLDAVAAGKTKVYVAEVSSYQLYSTRGFAPDVAVLLNITPDHVHWHKDFEAYRDAKFKVLDNLSRPPRSGSAVPGSDETPASQTGEAAATAAADVRCARANSPRVPSALASSHPQATPTRRLPSMPVAILDATNDVVRAKVREFRAIPRGERGFDYIPLGTDSGIRGDMRAKCGAENAAYLDGADTLHIAFAGGDHALLDIGKLLIKGEHNVSNALAAAAVAVVLGAGDAEVANALASFQPLAHRIEFCGTVQGVECYNDSKATNVDATLKALAAFPKQRVVVLLGGDDKGTDLAELTEAAFEHAGAAVCFGEGGPRFAEALSSSGAPEGFILKRANHLEDALDVALGVAKPGDVVLLSPACASFDEFRSFEHRGDVFKELVAVRAEEQGA